MHPSASILGTAIIALALAGIGSVTASAAAADLPCTTTRTETWSDGTRATYCKLARPVEVDGVRYGGFLWVDDRGRVRHGRLDAPAVIENAALPALSAVSRTGEGAIEHVFLPGTTMVEGHACRGGGHDYMTRFHPNGRLRTCWMDEDQEIDGVPCRDSGFFLLGGVSTEFHGNGRLAECTLSRAWTRDGATYRKGTRVRFDPEGRPLSGA